MTNAENYYSNFGELSPDEWVEKYLRRNDREKARINDTIAFLPADIESVLDVGAGFGLLLEELQLQRGIKGVGIEITDEKIAYARGRGIEMRKGDASQLEFPDKSVDLVVSCEVLEHLPFGVFERSLAEFQRVARRYVAVSVPYDERRTFVECPYCRATSHPYYHMREFDEDAMTNLFPTARLERVGYSGFRRRTLFQAWLRPQVNAPWPRSAVCPACGYHDTELAGVRVRGDTHSAVRKNIATRLLRSAARRALGAFSTTVPGWIMGLYSIPKLAPFSVNH